MIGSGVLHRERTEHEVLERVEAAEEGLAGARPEMAPQPDRLVEIGAANVEAVSGTEVGELGPVPADADAGADPAAAQRIERRELLGEDDRVALRTTMTLVASRTRVCREPTQASVRSAS